MRRYPPIAAAFCARYGDSFNRWWDDLGTPRLDEATPARLVANLSPAADPDDIRTLAAKRDALLTAVVAATHGNGGSGPVDSPSVAE